MLRKPLARRVFKALAILASLAVLGLGALLVALSLERRSEIALPEPTGPFAVGRSTYDWVDDATVDTLAPAPGTRRELLVWIWYPAEGGQSAQMDDYVPAQMQAAAGPARGALIFRLLTRDPSKVHG